MTSNKKIILTIIICTILVILLIIGFFIYLSFKPVGKGSCPPLLYLEDTLWREAPTFGKLPDETDYVGEIERYLPSGIPEENFATNAFPEGSKIYKSNLSETIYVEFEDSQGVTRYASFKQIEDNVSDISKEGEDGDESDSLTPEEELKIKLRRYRTVSSQEGEINFVSDYEPIMNICNDFCEEFIRTADPRRKSEPDFSLYINDPNLSEYLNYCAAIFRDGFAYDTKYIYTYLESDTFEYVLVRGGLFSGGSNSFAGYCSVDFLIKNIDGRCVIVDCSIDYKDSAERILKDENGKLLRGEFSVENNLDFWNTPEKYLPVMEKIKNS